ncbi:MAG: alkaline phosphatase [Rickettsiaceae bacterium]|nr:MAG: alkaline phosphatase [Rickettsiaceae bacterium]
MNINIDSIIFIGFLGFNLVFGLLSSKGIKNLKEYAIGDRNFSTATIAATLVATWMSGSDFFDNLYETYNNGLYFIWAAFGDVICLLSIGIFFAPRMGEFLGKLSIAEAMGDLYGKHARVITSIAGFIGTAGIIAVQLKVAGLLFEYCLGINEAYGIVTGCVIVTAYSAFGGIKSVTFTDVIQLFTFGTIIPSLALFILGTIDNLETVTNTLLTNELFDYKQVFDFSRPKSFEYLLLFFFVAVPGFNPAIFQRITMAKDVTQVRKSFVIAGLTCLFLIASMTSIGILVLSSYPGLEPSSVFKYVIFNHSYSGLKGLTLVGIMAMVMSTADSYINSSSVLFVHDFCEPLGIKVIKNQLTTSRIFSVITGLFALALSLSGETLLNLIIITNTFYLPIVTIPFILATLGFRSSSKSALIAMGAGFFTIIICKTILKMDSIESIIPGMLANLIFLLGSHYVLRQPGGWIGIKDGHHLKILKKIRRQKILLFVQNIGEFSVIKFLIDNTPKQKAIFVYLGIFCIISIFSVMYSLPHEIRYSYTKLFNFISPSVLILSTLLTSYPLWYYRILKHKILISIIWNVSLFYVLICVGYLLVMLSSFAAMQLMLFMINLIVFAMVTRWQIGLLMTVCGMFLTSQFVASYLKLNYLSDNSTSLEFKVGYLLLLFSTTLIAFLKPKQEHQELTEQQNEHLSGRISTQEEQVYKALGIREEFLRNIQHEYHTPMTGVLSLSEALLANYKKLSREKIGSYLESIYKSAVRIDSYDSNINMLSKLSRADYELNLKSINISSLLYERIGVCRKLYEHNKEDREFILDIQHNVTANIDKDYVIKLLDNLIINAITYCKQGKINITLQQDHKNISIAVQDEGIGIPRSEIDHIFGKFTVSSKTWTPAGGRGVGLALCQRVVEIHGGKIDAQSDGIKGAIFMINLPLS